MDGQALRRAVLLLVIVASHSARALACVLKLTLIRLFEAMVRGGRDCKRFVFLAREAGPTCYCRSLVVLRPLLLQVDKVCHWERLGAHEPTLCPDAHGGARDPASAEMR